MGIKLRRVKAVISYKGNMFKGFQKQTSTPCTVSGEMDGALASLGIASCIVGSGRTDAGVHATGQIIHFDLPSFWKDLKSLKEHLNKKLAGIYVKHISFAEDRFHARFSAKRRIYRYIFKSSPSIFEEEFVADLVAGDTLLLSKALDVFVGRYDFSNFIKSGSETKDNIREIYKAYYLQRGDYHYIYFEANGFLRAQVRMMIDFAIRVSNDEFTLEQLREQLSLSAIHHRNLAPPQGLYLSRVLY